MKKFECPNSSMTTEIPLTNFLSLVKAKIPGYPFDWWGFHSRNSVMTITFRKKNGKFEVGIILQPRPLHRVGLLAEFPAGKIEDGQSPEEAARMESKQEGGLVLCKPIQIGQPTMQFLHVIDETVYLYAALVKDQQAQELKDGEKIGGISLLWMPWDEFCNRIRIQESTGTPLIPGSPMDGVSLTSALKLMALGFNPEDLPEE